MKQELIETVVKMREEGYDFEETPALFKWSYEECPYVEFQLLIKENRQQEFSFAPPDMIQ